MCVEHCEDSGGGERAYAVAKKRVSKVTAIREKLKAKRAKAEHQVDQAAPWELPGALQAKVITRDEYRKAQKQDLKTEFIKYKLELCSSLGKPGVD